MPLELLMGLLVLALSLLQPPPPISFVTSVLLPLVASWYRYAQPCSLSQC